MAANAQDIMDNAAGGVLFHTKKTEVGATLNMIPLHDVHMGTSTDDHDATLSKISPVDNLFPALVECFGIILLGYIAGR